MTPDEKKLYALMAVAEQQQNLVTQAVKELQIDEIGAGGKEDDDERPRQDVAAFE